MANALAKPCRRWFRFSLRTLFVLLTLCGVSVGWVLREWQIVRERQNMREWLLSQTAAAVPDVIIPDGSSILCVLGELTLPLPRSQQLAVLQSTPQCAGRLSLIRRWLGDEYVEHIWLSDALVDWRREIEQLFPESKIVLESEVERDRSVAAYQRLVRVLSESTRFAFENAPLQDIVEYLKDLHNVEIQLNTRALEDASIGADTPVSFQADDIPLREALTGLLTPMQLRFVIRHDVLMITAEDTEQESN